jgi:hypothetical protein
MTHMGWSLAFMLSLIFSHLIECHSLFHFLHKKLLAFAMPSASFPPLTLFIFLAKFHVRFIPKNFFPSSALRVPRPISILFVPFPHVSLFIFMCHSPSSISPFFCHFHWPVAVSNVPPNQTAPNAISSSPFIPTIYPFHPHSGRPFTFCRIHLECHLLLPSSWPFASSPHHLFLFAHFFLKNHQKIKKNILSTVPCLHINLSIIIHIPYPSSLALISIHIKFMLPSL